VQIAKSYGAEVTGVCSVKNVEMVRSIGADHVIDYAREDFADGRRSYDVILDTAGNRSLSPLRRALTPRGCSYSSEGRAVPGSWERSAR
jgi:NADPH:quinone reductase-like Zn-dependent oxidoreductase